MKKKFTMVVILAASVTLFLAYFVGCANNSSSADVGSSSSSSSGEDETPNYTEWEQATLLDAYTPEESKRTLILKSLPTTEGILIEVSGLKRGAESWTAKIDGIGSVLWNYWNGSVSNTQFFYPFVEKGKEYKVRIAFDEWTDNVQWNDITVTAGGGKGEVLYTNFDETDFIVQQNGDFKFTTPPKLSNADAYKWEIQVEVYKGDWGGSIRFCIF